MSEQNKNETIKKDGVELEQVTFDEKGEVVGLDEEILDDVSGGLSKGAENNTGCGNSANLSC